MPVISHTTGNGHFIYTYKYFFVRKDREHRKSLFRPQTKEAFSWYARKESNLPRQNRNLESYPMDYGRIYPIAIVLYHEAFGKARAI